MFYYVLFETLGPFYEFLGYLAGILSIAFGLLDARVVAFLFSGAILSGIPGVHGIPRGGGKPGAILLGRRDVEAPRISRCWKTSATVNGQAGFGCGPIWAIFGAREDGEARNGRALALRFLPEARRLRLPGSRSERLPLFHLDEHDLGQSQIRGAPLCKAEDAEYAVAFSLISGRGRGSHSLPMLPRTLRHRRGRGGGGLVAGTTWKNPFRGIRDDRRARIRTMITTGARLFMDTPCHGPG